MTQLFSTLSSLSLAQDRNSGNQNTWRKQALQAFLNLRWSPTGVGVKIYYVLGPVFGFNGSGLHPFNQAPFVNGGPQDLDV